MISWRCSPTTKSRHARSLHQANRRTSETLRRRRPRRSCASKCRRISFSSSDWKPPNGAHTAITDPEEIVRLHFGESMFAASAVPIRNGRLADIGSGPGFPSIPISMVKKEIISVPIESNSKKSTFQSEVQLRRLSLTNRSPVSRPYGVTSPLSEALTFDWITARALLGDFPSLFRWSKQADWSHEAVVSCCG